MSTRESEVIDRRDALEEAFDSAEADARGEEYTPPVRERSDEPEGRSESETAETDPAVIEQEASNRPVKEKQRTRGVPPGERGKSTVIGDPTDPSAVQNTAVAEVQAPQSWKAEDKAVWAAIPPAARAVIQRRELEIQQGMSRAGNIQKVAQEYADVVKPFEQVIRGMNTTPREAIRNVMTTATALIQGDQKVKAAVILEMIQNYGVDLPNLDKVLTEALTKAGGRFQPVNTPNPMLDPRVQQQFQPLFAMQAKMQEQETQRQQALITNAEATVTTYSAKPHFQEVRHDMADIMEISAKRGIVMTPEQAYQKALLLNDKTSKIVQQRARGSEVSRAASTLARSRRAASTVSGAPAGGGSRSTGTDRRAALEAAWDETT